MNDQATVADFKTPLPPAVRKQAEAAAAAHDEFLKSTAASPQVVQEASQGAPAPVSEPQLPEATLTVPTPAAPTDATPAQPQPPATPPQAPVDAQPPADAAPQQPADSTQATLQAAVQAAEQRAATAEYKLRQMQSHSDRRDAEHRREIEEINRKLEEMTSRPKPTITDADREEFGEDMIELVEKVAASKVAQETEQLRRENADLKFRMNVTAPGASPAPPQVDAARDEMYKYMDTVCPNWRTLNGDPNFIAWLAQHDPLLGKTKQERLNEASADNDGITAAAIFNAYQPAQQPAPAPSAPAGGTASVSMESLVAPGVSGAGTAPVPTEGQVLVYTQNEVRQFYEDVRRGRWDNDPVGRAKLENEIVTAVREGRITGTSSLAPPGNQPN